MTVMRIEGKWHMVFEKLAVINISAIILSSKYSAG